jgi:uncharacterized membrane protein
VPIRQQLRVAQTLIYVGIVHGLALTERPVLAIGALAAFFAASVAINVATRGSRAELAFWSVALAVALAIVFAADRGWKGAVTVVLLPPVLVNLGLLYIFGKTLLPGRVPLITRFSTINFSGRIPAPLVSYTRRLTILWAALFAIMVAESAVVGAYADLATWSWTVNILNPVVMVAFFVAEHFYRLFRYSDCGPHSLIRAIRIVIRPDAWISTNAEPGR